MTEQLRKGTVLVLRIILGVVFTFSGFVKAVDPWGTAIKIGEYLTEFGMEWLSPMSMTASVVQSGLELAIGIALLLGLRKKLTSLLTMLFMLFFAVLTFYIAIANPVEDCGCFGDAIKLTNWQTFYKNIILLPMSIVLWRWSTRIFRMRENMWLVLIFILSCGIGLWSLRHLPLADFLPYKTGTDLIAAKNAVGGQIKTTLVYRDRQNGRTRNFELSDTTWYDDSKWEYVDTIIETSGNFRSATAADFAVFTEEDDMTDAILSSPSKVTLLCVTNPSALKGRCKDRMVKAVEKAVKGGNMVVCVTPVPIDSQSDITLGQNRYPIYNIDGTLLKTLIRAKNGIVEIDKGTITTKNHCLDL